jgi:hypothetical protein
MKKILVLTLSLATFICADEFVESSTTVGGYGELHYNMESNNGNGKLDFHRFILYVKHQFNDKWSMMSEMEIEHNMVYSDGDGGYLAMEQAHLDYNGGNWGFRGGVVLVPAGIINEYHEPPTFMSVERPEYNKYIIPSTWFENGFSFYGNRGDLNWNFTMTGDMLGNKISASKALRSARLKGVYSTTTDWTKTLQLSWAGIEGLKVGGSVTMNDAPVWEEVLDADGNLVEYNYDNQVGTHGFTLTEVNATYSKNNMYARFENGSISYDGVSGLESSSGYYLDLGYDIAGLVGCDDSNMYLWTRTSSYNKDDMGDDHEISLFGLTYKPANNLSIKFETGESGGSDVMNLGLGYMF